MMSLNLLENALHTYQIECNECINVKIKTASFTSTSIDIGEMYDDLREVSIDQKLSLEVAKAKPPISKDKSPKADKKPETNKPILNASKTVTQLPPNNRNKKSNLRKTKANKSNIGFYILITILITILTITGFLIYDLLIPTNIQNTMILNH